MELSQRFSERLLLSKNIKDNFNRKGEGFILTKTQKTAPKKDCY